MNARPNNLRAVDTAAKEPSKFFVIRLNERGDEMAIIGTSGPYATDEEADAASIAMKKEYPSLDCIVAIGIRRVVPNPEPYEVRAI